MTAESENLKAWEGKTVEKIVLKGDSIPWGFEISFTDGSHYAVWMPPPDDISDAYLCVEREEAQGVEDDTPWSFDEETMAAVNLGSNEEVLRRLLEIAASKIR